MKDGNQMLFYSDDKVDSSFCEHFWLRKKKKDEEEEHSYLGQLVKIYVQEAGFLKA